MLPLVVTLLEVATDVGSTVVVTSAVEDFNVVEVALVMKSIVDKSAVVLP